MIYSHFPIVAPSRPVMLSKINNSGTRALVLIDDAEYATIARVSQNEQKFWLATSLRGALILQLAAEESPNKEVPLGVFLRQLHTQALRERGFIPMEVPERLAA